MSVLLLEYPTCSTCRKAKKWLDAHSVDYVDRDIVADNPTAKELALWHERSGLPVRRLFNTSGMRYRELGVKARLDSGMTCSPPMACSSSARCSWVRTLSSPASGRGRGPRRSVFRETWARVYLQ